MSSTMEFVAVAEFSIAGELPGLTKVGIVLKNGRMFNAFADKLTSKPVPFCVDGMVYTVKQSDYSSTMFYEDDFAPFPMEQVQAEDEFEPFLTDADVEQARSEAKYKAWIRPSFSFCPFCGEAIQRSDQVGNSLFAQPCGHRLVTDSF